MYQTQDAFLDQRPTNGDYHTLLQTQIYDCLLSIGTCNCGEALLEYNCHHNAINNTARQCTTELHTATPPLSDPGFWGSNASPPEQPYYTTSEHSPSTQNDFAALNQQSCIFWDAPNFTQDRAAGAPMQGFSYPPGLSPPLLGLQPMTSQQSFDVQSSPSVLKQSPPKANTPESNSAKWRPISPASDKASTTLRKRSESNAGLLRFQNHLGGLIKHNKRIVKSLQSQRKRNRVSSCSD